MVLLPKHRTRKYQTVTSTRVDKVVGEGKGQEQNGMDGKCSSARQSRWIVSACTDILPSQIGSSATMCCVQAMIAVSYDECTAEQAC